MKKFVLVEVIEREVSVPEIFNTLKEAKTMLTIKTKDIKETVVSEDGMSAYGETENHDNWDAKIFIFEETYLDILEKLSKDIESDRIPEKDKKKIDAHLNALKQILFNYSA